MTSVFAANALLVYGFELCPGFRGGLRANGATALAIVAIDCLAAGLLWCIRVLALAPFGLERLDLFVYALVAVPLLKVLSRAIAPGAGFLSRVGATADGIVVSCLVFGVALVASRSSFGPVEALLAGAASGLGYWLAAALLEALRERLELSDLPAAMRGSPALLVSAGLMSMAFMGIDSILVKNLVR